MRSSTLTRGSPSGRAGARAQLGLREAQAKGRGAASRAGPGRTRGRVGSRQPPVRPPVPAPSCPARMRIRIAPYRPALGSAARRPFPPARHFARPRPVAILFPRTPLPPAAAPSPTQRRPARSAAPPVPAEGTDRRAGSRGPASRGTPPSAPGTRLRSLRTTRPGAVAAAPRDCAHR